MRVRDERPWIKLHDGMIDHPKVVGLSDRAFRLLIETWSYCGRNLTDGDVPAGWWQRRPTKVRAELHTAGLMIVSPDGGAVVHDYLEWQRSSADVTAQTESRRKAGAAGGRAASENRKKQRLHVASATAPAVALATPRATADVVADGQQTGSKPVADLEVEVELEREREEPKVKRVGAIRPAPPTQIVDARSRRGRRLPSDWDPTPDLRAWTVATKHADGREGDGGGLTEAEAQHQLDQFKDHWHAASGSSATKLSWDLAWKTWVRRARPPQPRRGYDTASDILDRASRRLDEGT